MHPIVAKKALEYWTPDSVIILTSTELGDMNEEFFEEVRESGVLFRIIREKTFDADSLNMFITEMGKAVADYQNLHGDVALYAGLTGGTNIMVSALSVFAASQNAILYYIVEESEEMIQFQMADIYTIIK